MPRKPKPVKIQPYSRKMLQNLKIVAKKHKIAEIHHDILESINTIHNEIRKQTLLVRKNPDDLRAKDILENLKSHKQSKERQIQSWIEAKKPTTMKKFEKFISEKCSTNEARLPVFGDISFKNCILNNMRFIASKPEDKKIIESIPNLNNNDYRIIIINGHGAIEGGIVIQGKISNQPTIKQDKNAPVILPKLPNGMWYFAQSYPGASTVICRKVDTAQFQNLNSQQKRNNFVRRLFSDGTFQTFLHGKHYEQSDTAMVGVPTMPFYNKAWDFGQWEEHRTIMGIYDISDPNYSFNIDAIRQVDSDDSYLYPTLTGHTSPSELLRDHIYYHGTIAGNTDKEPYIYQFHYKRLLMIRRLLSEFRKQYNRNPTTEELKNLTKGKKFSFKAYEKTNDYPLKLTAANTKFKNVYRNELFASDWAPLRSNGNAIVDPIAKGSDGVSIRQRMIDTMNTKRDITMNDLLKWFNPNAPNAVDKRKVIFIDWSCQPLSVSVKYNGITTGVDLDTLPDPTRPYPREKIPSLLGFQATRLAFEKMARKLNLTFSRVQSLFEEKNGKKELGDSPFNAEIAADQIGVGNYLLGRSARQALSSVPIDIDDNGGGGGESKAVSQTNEKSNDYAPPFGGRKKRKTRRKLVGKSRRKRSKRKTKRK